MTRLVISIIALATMFGLWQGDFAALWDDCRIKGNISTQSGERIYHVPGGQYYGRTGITTSKGERWFCSEAEARAAGWRRSRR